jgi:hypothetical protein
LVTVAVVVVVVVVVVSYDRLVLVVFLPPLSPPFHAPNVPPLLAW